MVYQQIRWAANKKWHGLTHPRRLAYQTVMPEKSTLTLTELAAHIGMAKRTLYRRLENGDFPVDPLPRLRPRRWSTEAVNAWMRGEG